MDIAAERRSRGSRSPVGLVAAEGAWTVEDLHSPAHIGVRAICRSASTAAKSVGDPEVTLGLCGRQEIIK
jgi:hypothetical protein